jgi:integrase
MARNRRSWGKIRRLPSQRWQASYVGPDRIRHTAPVTYTKRLDAEGWLSSERRLVERDDWTPPAQRAAEKHARGITVSDYTTVWIAQRSIKRRTSLHYEALLANQLAPLGKVPLRHLTPEAVRAWHSSLPRTTISAHAYGLLHAICATAVGDGLLAANPCTVSRGMKTPKRREPVILTVPEIAALADAVPERFRALVLISAWCGLRWGEITELRRKDISAGAEIISVSRGVTHRGGCRIDTPKSGRGRVVVVPPHVRGDLLAHLEDYVKPEGEALLFPAPRACHLDDKGFRVHFQKALKAVGREGVRVHDLRHFAGTQAARVGSLIETMDRLGHSTVGASLRYQHAVSGRDAEIAEALSRLAGQV